MRVCPFFPQQGGQPVPRALRVGHGLLGGEGLGLDDDQRARGIELARGVGEIGTIDIGDEMHVRPVGIGNKRANRHGRSEIGAADTDADHVRERLAVAGGNRTGTHTLCKVEKTLQCRCDFVGTGDIVATFRIARGHM